MVKTVGLSVKNCRTSIWTCAKIFQHIQPRPCYSLLARYNKTALKEVDNCRFRILMFKNVLHFV